MNLPRIYTAIVGAAFLFLVGFTLVTDTHQHGVTIETFHKLIHVSFGAWAAVIVFRKLNALPFVWTNVLLWGAFAVIGWAAPDFLGLKAFGRADAILHTIVASTGIIALVFNGKR